MTERTYRPVLGIKVRVHCKPAKCEMAQNQPSVYIPALEVRYRGANDVKVALDRTGAFFFRHLEGWQLPIEVRLKQLL
jgi:hypothetical protein